ncbi:chemotaxis protein [Kitasatospora sp. DSM 101779]|uniref:baeRF3 domain-containing protein n=1 Tax=Kitasatospora sp. DSM 101779 TaxID=2853165 RepID=UPI0021DB20F7|nr:chemotaxis protein [Kitasatospora sp. DSM 101779]MCU7821712.1 chemotaxis protein [Kitasatospora sp. DSM 101779]
METDSLTSDTLRELRSARPYPAVSLTMPTHRREPDNAQDAVRLRNLLAEAERRIDADPEASRQDRIDLHKQLERAVAEVDLRHSLDGLVVYATTNEHQVWSLPREVPERVVLSDTFLTRNLVAAKAQERPYWVMAVAADRATLWSGAGLALHEHKADGFPMEAEGVDWDVQREERTGGQPSTFSNEETRRFLRSVDAALGTVLGADRRPLFLIGLPQAVSALQEVGTAAGAAVATVLKGGLTDGPDRALLQELAPAMAQFASHESDRVSTALDAARSRKAFAAGLDEVWEAVCEGRVDMVAVEEHFQRTMRLADGHLAPAEDGGPGGWEEGVREDIVDELVETALDKGAEVVFVPDDELTAHDHIAAVLRY